MDPSTTTLDSSTTTEEHSTTTLEPSTSISETSTTVEASTTPSIPTLPQSVTNLTLNATGNSIIVSWTNVENSGQIEIHYEAITNVTISTNITVDYPNSTYSITPVSHGTLYAVNVTAISASNSRSDPTTQSIPITPNSVTAIDIEVTNISISFKLPNISGYFDYVLVTGPIPDKVIDYHTLPQTVIHGSLKSNTVYNFTCVVVTNMASNSSSTAFSSKTSNGIPGVPQNLTVKTINSTSIELQWTAPSNENGNIVSYDVETQTLVTPSVSSKHVTSTSIIVDSLEAGTGYKFRVRARTSWDYPGNWTDFTTDTFTKDQPPSSVQSLEVTQSDGRFVQVTWSKPATPGGILWGYLLTMSPKGGACENVILYNCTNCKWSQIDMTSFLSTLQSRCPNFASPNSTVNVTSSEMSSNNFNKSVPYVIAGTSYTVHLTSLNRVEPNEASWISKDLLTRSETPEKITNVVANTTDSTFSVSWTVGKLNGQFKHISIKLSSSDQRLYNITDLANTTYTFEGLLSCTNYSVVVWAENTKLEGDVSDSVSKNTLAKLPNPSVIQSDTLNLTALNSTSLNVSWIPLSNFSCPIRYKVKLTSKDNPVNTKEVESNSVIFVDLQPFTDYTATVQVIVGNNIYNTVSGNASNPKTGKTSEAEPGVVLQFECSQPTNTYSTVFCKWVHPNVTNGIILSYTIYYELKGGTYDVSTGTNVTQSSITNNIVADFPIFLWIVAANAAGKRNDKEANFTITLTPGPPMDESLNVDSYIRVGVLPVKDGLHAWNSFPLSINRNTFNEDHGQITNRTLVVSQKNINAGSNIPNFGTYESTEAGKNGFYEVNLIFNQPTSRRKRSTPDFGLFVLGDPEIDANNGHLSSDATYNVAPKACTNGGCRILKMYSVKTEPAPANAGAIAGGIIAALIIIAIIIGAVFIWKRNQNKNRAPTSPESRALPELHPPKPVPYGEFETFVTDLSRDADKKFAAHFEMLSDLSKKNVETLKLTQIEANRDQNKGKNRYSNISSYDQSRVKLSSEEDPTSTDDYINASYIPGAQGTRVYIACQGPLACTLDDFWRMIWEKEVPIIIMLTKCVEHLKAKCEQYWPNTCEEPRLYGNIRVDMTQETYGAFYVTRVFKISVSNEVRIVHQLHTLKWEDHSALEMSDFMELLKGFKSLVPSDRSRPTVVHCSAGVGRTGSFICMDTIVSRLEMGDPTIDIFKSVTEMRKNRPNMVQTERQYIFIHKFVLHYLKENGYLESQYANYNNAESNV